VNPLVREAAGAVQLGWLLGVMTVVFFAVFLAWIWYAWSPANRAAMEEARHMPFTEGGDA
jgi:cbb3-type cytochrome oxidase subunit 3